MATLFHLPRLLPFSAHNQLFSFRQGPLQLPSGTYRYPCRKTFKICVSSSSKRPRVGRKVKSNAELCSEIREFVSLVGLPEGHVPSMKVLSEHGRNDLAHIVRRRGYKLIKELLATSSKADNSGFNTEKSIIESHGAICDSEDTLKGQNANGGNAVQEVPLSTEVYSAASNSLNSSINADDQCSMKECSLSDQDDVDNTMVVEDISPAYNETDELNSVNESGECISEDKNNLKPAYDETDELNSVEESGECISENKNNLKGAFVEDISPSTNISFGKSSSCSQNDNHKFDPMESTSISTLEPKVARFIQNGELEAIEYNINGILDESSDKDQEEGVTMKYEDTIHSRMSNDNEELGGTAITSNGTMVMPSVVAAQAVNHASWSDMEGEQLISYDAAEDLSTKATKEDQIEINRLRSMLHQKELELLHLREQIEKGEIALSVLQIKAETEIEEAQKLISELDAELDAVEEGLSGLEEVNIQYSGEGEIVEVTGSFNGWYHRIKLDPQPSSAAVDSIGSGEPRRCSTMLRLYPGTYEIKFIVDGQWTIDPQRESITRGGICNNILRVDSKA